MPVMGYLRISDASSHAFAAVLKGMVVAGVGAYLTFPSTSAPVWRVAALSLLHLCFIYGVTG